MQLLLLHPDPKHGAHPNRSLLPPNEKEHRNCVLGFLTMLQSGYTGIQTLTLSCCGTSFIHVQTLCSRTCESLKGFYMQAVFKNRTGDWEIWKQRTASILDLVLWFFPVPCTELTERKEKETHFGFSHLKSIVTPQPFIVLLFTIFKCPIVSGWFTLYK